MIVYRYDTFSIFACRCLTNLTTLRWLIIKLFQGQINEAIIFDIHTDFKTDFKTRDRHITKKVNVCKLGYVKHA